MPDRRPNLVRIGDEIINLDNLLRVERAVTHGNDVTVLLYFADQPDQSATQYSGPRAAAVWEKFAAMAEAWDVPDSTHTAPAGPGRVASKP